MLILWSLPVFSEYIFLKNGEVFEAAIKKETDTYYIVTVKDKESKRLAGRKVWETLKAATVKYEKKARQ